MRNVVTGLLGVLLVCTGLQAADEKGGKMLSAQDLAEIQQLYASYATAIDTRAENGMVWARMFTPDGEFRTGDIKAAGHKALADMNKRDGKPSPIPTHFTTNITVESTSEGARGTAYLLITGNTPEGRASVGSAGVYQDALVKTAEGWRFRSRTLHQGSMAPPAAVPTAPIVRHKNLKGGKLTHEDRAEIQQLYARYATAIDTRAENGMVWARMFVPDGEFQTGERKVVGHEKLAEMIRGDGKPSPIPTHFTQNIKVEPSAEGATGSAYLLIVGKGADGRFTASSASTYSDVLVKTAEGWRFKKRTLYTNAMKPQ